MRILGIETSCDETGVAIYDEHNGLLINKVYSQMLLHANYGGVVPELAARHHIKKIGSLIQCILQETKLTPREIDGIAYTAGPGLSGSLLTGASFGRSLAFALNIPSLQINHLEGHIFTPFIENNNPIFPFVSLIISGSNTLLVNVIQLGKYQLLGHTIDDAVGEAFDKIAQLLGLKYPGGSKLSQLARQGKKNRFILPRPLINRPGLDFSFSGLKTYTTTLFHKEKHDIQTKADIARSFEDAIIDILLIKSQRALDLTKVTQLVIVGGVSSNNTLRSNFNNFSFAKKILYGSPEFCTDNGAMIAYVGFLRFKHGQQSSNLKINVYPRWSLNNLFEVF
ncbi:MAG: tRNA (adenosine(37)-N6)-threonylcarbamoyltransferase complex transferase subunit TsaD [Candidatus Dasytiphilus stammeri]